MDAQFERRLLLSMNGRNSSSCHQSPIQSPIKSSDRYIPLRSSLSASNLHYPLNASLTPASPRKVQCSSTVTSPTKHEQHPIGLSAGVTASESDLAVYEQLLQNTLLNDNALRTNLVTSAQASPVSKENVHAIFRYSERPSAVQLKSSDHFSRSPISNASIHLLHSLKKSTRHIPDVPYKVLDAPDLQDDFYLNLIDWSPSNILSVGLGACIYLHNAQSNHVQLLCDLAQSPLPSLTNHQPNIIGSDAVTSVQWSDWSNILAVGKNELSSSVDH